MAQVRSGKKPPDDTHATSVGPVSVGTLRHMPTSCLEAQEFSLALFDFLNQRSVSLDNLREALTKIRDYTGFQAVGLRLRNEEEYPYYATIGFPDHFINSENSLCSRDHHGELVRDFCGRPVLQCMCGEIIRAALTYPVLSY